MQPVNISEAFKEDREWTATLLAGSEPWITLGATLEKCRASCHLLEHRIYIARCDGERCGAIVLHPRGLAGSPYIKSIAVTENFRGSGVGSALLDFAENLFRQEFRHIFLCVSSFNPRAQSLYERRGYRAVGAFADYIVEGASEILMHKRLR